MSPHIFQIRESAQIGRLPDSIFEHTGSALLKRLPCLWVLGVLKTDHTQPLVNLRLGIFNMGLLAWMHHDPSFWFFHWWVARRGAFCLHLLPRFVRLPGIHLLNMLVLLASAYAGTEGIGVCAFPPCLLRFKRPDVFSWNLYDCMNLSPLGA